MTTQEKIQEFKDYYKKLLISQFNNKEKALATINLLSEQFVVDGLIFDLINPAIVGGTFYTWVLDLINQYIGVSRYAFGFQRQNLKYTMLDYENDTTYWGQGNFNGFSDYQETFNDGMTFMSYTDTNNPSFYIPNNYFIILMLLKIGMNNIRATHANRLNLVYKIFGDNVRYIDNLDMTITLEIKTEYLEIVLLALNVKCFPISINCAYTYTVF